MWKRLARKPSTASLMPATKNNRNATLISPSVIAQTTIGTSKIRPKVMRFGILKPFPSLRRGFARQSAPAPMDGAAAGGWIYPMPRASFVDGPHYSGAGVLAHSAIPT
jgi:hypothetical protein